MIDFYRFVTSCIKKTSCESGTENCIRFDFAAVYEFMLAAQLPYRAQPFFVHNK